jgi:hypothetical protein
MNYRRQKSKASTAFTLTEAIIAMVLTFIAFSLMWNFWSASRRGEHQLTGGFSTQQDLSLSMEKISAEVREGIKLFYPLPGAAEASEGIAFVGADGQAIAYYIDRTDKAAALYRVNISTGERKIIAKQVNYFKTTVNEPLEGKKVCLVNMNLSLLRGDTDIEGKADDYNIIKKVFLRNLK